VEIALERLWKARGVERADHGVEQLVQPFAGRSGDEMHGDLGAA